MRGIACTLAFASAVSGCNAIAPVPAGSANANAIARMSPSAVQTVGGCQIFPTPPPTGPSGNDWWNQDITNYPVDPKSAGYIKPIAGEYLHPDFGQNRTYGIPFVVVPKNQKLVPVKFTAYPSSSNPGPYPIPANAPIEGGPKSNGDRHVLVLQQGACKLYEMWRAFPVGGGKSWKAAEGAVFVLGSNKLRPNGWTSADAAGLPILPALVKCAEVAAGEIDHPLRVTFNQTQAGYIHPATHYASSSRNPTLLPMGARLRLKASFDISHFNRVAQIILTAMQHYGMFVADNGSDWYFQGEGTGNNPKSCWNDNQLDELKTVSGSNFEVVQTGRILR
jgi:hypothetical protein